MRRNNLFCIFIFISFLFMLTTSSFGEGFAIDWTSTYNSSNNSYDEGSGIALDNSGNIYVTGYENRVDLGQQNNIWVGKYNSSGFEVWTSSYNSPNNNNDYGNDIAVDSSGNVYVIGSEYRSDLGEHYNIWVRKYDTNGNTLWTSTYNSPNNNDDYGNGIAVDGSGNVYVTGSEYRDDLGEEFNIWVRKYDTNGFEIWTSTYSSPNDDDDHGNGIAVDNSGNVYVIGSESRSVLLQGDNIWVRKYDANGNTLWTETYNSPDNQWDEGFGIAVDGSGNVYVTGYEYRGDLLQGDNIWVRKYDANGNTLWTKTYTSPNNSGDYGNGIAVDSSGSVYVIGSEYRSDLGEHYNIWVRKYDTNGNTLWTSTYNSPNNSRDKGRGIVLDNSGNIYVTGYEYRSDLGEQNNIWTRKYIQFFDIAGTITDESNPLQGVTVNLTGDSTASTITDANGNYIFNNLNGGGTYTVTPTDTNYTFNPENRLYSNLNGSITNANFTKAKDFADDLENVIAYPNPWKHGMGINVITFDNLMENSKIQIYTFSGNLVFEVEVDSVDYQWDLKNKDGNDIASGIYIYFITDDKGKEKSGKFAIIK